MVYDLPNQDKTNSYIQFGFIIFDIVTFCYLLFKRAQYGKFKDNKRTSFLLTTHVAWVLQEIPNLIVSLYYSYHYITTNKENINPIKFIMLSMFVIHYFHRTLIFPFKLVNTKTWPLELSLSAATFTTFNSIQINRSISFSVIMG
jgi:hypothetical protein